MSENFTFQNDDACLVARHLYATKASPQDFLSNTTTEDTYMYDKRTGRRVMQYRFQASHGGWFGEGVFYTLSEDAYSELLSWFHWLDNQPTDNTQSAE